MTLIIHYRLKPGFHYPSWRPVNSASGNRALHFQRKKEYRTISYAGHNAESPDSSNNLDSGQTIRSIKSAVIISIIIIIIIIIKLHICSE